ncbi:stearoyl-CoA desaturase 5-like [Carlito syrichta]|uniref:Stearoyl-CoA desaturase 5-like n=1 Tax=Carlito syrichta TaxID=1868482 RepID=A0A1U7T961_CARSF|nr:stearoyl-CoA desaturase 5-like [Carlito syrichta]
MENVAFCCSLITPQRVHVIGKIHLAKDINVSGPSPPASQRQLERGKLSYRKKSGQEGCMGLLGGPKPECYASSADVPTSGCGPSLELPLPLGTALPKAGPSRSSLRYYKISVILMCFVVPTLVPWCAWGESLWNAYFLASILRYAVSLNVTWLVNSAAHMYGNRPYDKNISPRQNPLVAVGAIGEGFHNYHHTFPFDYSASEFGLKFNPTTWFIDAMCLLGLATDRKRAPKPMIEARKAKTGDGST